MRAWYELRFQLEFCTRTGTEFQTFFWSIMDRRFSPDFQRVRPYGAKGDLKCDGYHTSLQRVYQVYAPESMKVRSTNAKIDEDLQGAIANWPGLLKEWVFVHNQYKSGLPGEVLQKLLGLNGQKGITIGHWCDTELRSEFFKLLPADQIAILGHAPTEQSMTHLQMSDVVVVANALAQQPAPLQISLQRVAPGKMEANALSEWATTLLTNGTRKSKLVKKLFDSWHDPELGDRIAATFRSKYVELRNIGLLGDDLFNRLWQFGGGGKQQTAAHESAVLALLAFLFEECEIFEPAPQLVSK